MRAIRLTIGMAGAALAMALAATPAAAQHRAADGTSGEQASSAQELSETLRDPQVQATATATAAVLGEVLLAMPVGPLVEAMDAAVEQLAEEAGRPAPPAPAVDPDAALRDVLGPQGDRATARLAKKVPQAMDAAARLTVAADALAPVLRDAAERMKRALPARLPVLTRD